MYQLMVINKHFLNNPEFTISVCIRNYGKVSACASSKKVAE